MIRTSRFQRRVAVLGFAFLYLPILLLVIYSFNASRLVTVWGGFSTSGTFPCSAISELLDAAWVTLRVAFLSATVATVLGTLAAIALVALRRFKRPHAVLRHDLRAAGHARGHHRPVAAAAVRGDRASTAASGPSFSPTSPSRCASSPSSSSRG
jgi:hypothetical protein